MQIVVTPFFVFLIGVSDLLEQLEEHGFWLWASGNFPVLFHLSFSGQLLMSGILTCTI